MDVPPDPPLNPNGTNDIVHICSEYKALTTSGPNNTLSERDESGNDSSHSKLYTENDDLYTQHGGMAAEYHVRTAEYDTMASERGVVAAKEQHMTSKHDTVTSEHNDVAAEHEALLETSERTADIQLEMNRSEDNLELVSDKASAPDGGWGWLIILGCLILRSILGGLGRSGGLFYMRFLERFNGSATSTALITSLTGFLRLSAGLAQHYAKSLHIAYTLSIVLGQALDMIYLGPFVSILCSRFTGRSLTAVGAGLLFLGLIMSAYTPSQGFLYFSYGVVTGLGRAFSLTPCPIMLGHYFDKRRSLAFGLASAGFSLGGFTITPMVELLFQWFGFQGAFLILSGFVMNVFVCSALFRPIELHRKLTATTHRNKESKCEQQEAVDGLEHHDSNAMTSAADSKDKMGNGYKTETAASVLVNSDNQVQNGHASRQSSISNISRNVHLETSNNKTDLSEHVPKEGKEESNNTTKKKKRVLSLSILRDVRFLCFVFATFCFTLPATFTFLPPLATSKGITVLQAATLLSINSGSDTIFRVISGFVLDLKWFRAIRPQIYNLVTFLQGIVLAFYPSMTTYPEFVAWTLLDGMIGGIKNAQGSVVMLDMLGVDKFASSMAYTMAVQGIAVFIGPTVSGQLKDIYGTYDGSFYFGSAAILSGGLVMAVGNIRKHIMDKQIAKQKESQIAKQTELQMAT